ncbi:MAG: ABC transporter substrate-binding protein, partial [Clostridiales Family XIII bacterium]|nr:ABC transporter substrate-binding protein [Clostridiales Family XIII bacterium]
ASAPLLSACEEGVGAILSGVSDAGAGAGAGPVAVSEEIFLPMEKIRSLNPLNSKDEDSFFINSLIYDSLFELDDSLAASGSLAESWSYGEDGLSLSIRLLGGALWEDGEPLDAGDVAFSVNCYSSYPESHLFYRNVANIRNVRTDRSDPLMLTIDFKSADGAGVELLTFPVLPSHLYRNPSDLNSRVGGFVPVGSGPYRVAEFDAYTHVTLEGSPSYRGGTPTNRLVFEMMPFRDDALNMLDIDAISYAVSKAYDRDAIYRNPSVNVTNFISNEAVWIGYNFGKEAMRDMAFRQAVALAIDNEELLETCFFKSGVVGDSIYYPGFLGVGGAYDPYPFDLGAAKSRFAEAGLADQDQDGLLEYFASDGEGGGLWTAISPELLVDGDETARVAAAGLIQASLARAGLDCRVKALAGEEYLKALEERDFDMYMGGGRFSDSYDLRPLLHSAWDNPVAYVDSVLDPLLDSFARPCAPEERRRLFQEIHAVMTERIPYYCLMYKTYAAVSSPSFRGSVDPSFRNIYRACEGWTREISAP